MKRIVRSGHPVDSSTVPSPSVPAGNSGKTRNIRGKGTATVMPSVKPAVSNKRGGPAVKAPSGKGVVSSGGGSFGQN